MWNLLPAMFLTAPAEVSRLHRQPGPAVQQRGGLVAGSVGPAGSGHCHDNQLGGAGQGQVRAVLAGPGIQAVRPAGGHHAAGTHSGMNTEHRKLFYFTGNHNYLKSLYKHLFRCASISRSGSVTVSQCHSVTHSLTHSLTVSRYEIRQSNI